MLLQLAQQISSVDEATPTITLPSSTNGSCSDDTNSNGTTDGSSDLSNSSNDFSIRVSPENIILRLVRVFGPDQALTALQEHGIQVDLSSRSTLVCDLLRMAEKRQR